MANTPDKPREERGMPTPDIGLPIVWFKGGRRENGPIAARCLAQEAAGKIAVKVNEPRGVAYHRSGVWHMSHPSHKKSGSASARNGGWDFMPSMVPKNAYDVHRAEQERIQAAKERSEQARLEKEAKYKELQSQGIPTL